VHWSLVRIRFEQLFERPETEIPLDLAALIVAQEEYPDLDCGSYLRRFDALADLVRSQRPPQAGVSESVDAINHVLFDLEGFHGNQTEYYDPRNSFLNAVFDRKLGIPITLSIVYLALCKRLGIDAWGIGLPGHFIVAIGESDRLIVDPFDRGARLTIADCASRVRQIYGDKVTLQADMLAPLTKRMIITRLLTNLKAIYVNQADPVRALAATERLLVLNPFSQRELRDRGVLGRQVKFYAQSESDLQRYLEIAAAGSDLEEIRRIKRDLEREWGIMN